MDRENLTAGDFTVFVRNLPKDATEEEVREHFSALYQLQGPEPTARRCCRRRRMRPVPVFRLDPEGNPTAEEEQSDAARKFAHPWVAQVEIAHPVGGLIRAYARSRKLTRKLEKVGRRGAPPLVAQGLRAAAHALPPALPPCPHSAAGAQARAHVQMWSEGTEHKGGPNAAEKAKAEEKLGKLMVRECGREGEKGVWLAMPPRCHTVVPWQVRPQPGQR